MTLCVLLKVRVSCSAKNLTYQPTSIKLINHIKHHLISGGNMIFTKFFITLVLSLSLQVSAQSPCPSEATLIIKSSGYSGPIDIEIRQGTRPGSNVIGRDRVITSGSVIFRNVCPGTYFYSFSTPNTDIVSTTRYFEVINDGTKYSMPTVTVTYTQSSSGNKVGTSKRSEL